MIRGHGGNVAALAKTLGCAVSEIVDVSNNVNPLGPPSGLMDHLKSHIDHIQYLPEVDSAGINAMMADKLGIDCSGLTAGNGTTQFIYTLVPALEARRVLIATPTYTDYEDGCRMHGLQPDYFKLEPEKNFVPDLDQLGRKAGSYDAVIICNPNNPTGSLIQGEALKALCRQHKETCFVIDESYLPFVAKARSHSLVPAGLNNVVVLHSFSKIFRIPGLRIGFLISTPEIVARFHGLATPWCVSSLAQTAISYIAAHEAEMASFMDKTHCFIEKEKKRFVEALRPCSAVKPYPSSTSFVLIRLVHPFTAKGIAAEMAAQRILIRDCSNFSGLSNRFIRIAMKRRSINDRVAHHLLELLARG